MAQTETHLIQIPDPVHGYIPVEPRFMDIVDTPEFQRLRSIEQGNFRPVFPGARHDRFIHSLGTYHLATKFVTHFFQNLRQDVKGIKLKREEEETLSLTFRYAALLHDIGHAPFSHTTENLFMEEKDDQKIPMIWHRLCEELEAIDPVNAPRFRDSTDEEKGAAHEIMSARVLLRNHQKFTGGKKWSGVQVDPELAVRMIIGYTYSDQDTDHASRSAARIQELGIRNCLIQMLNSSTMDVDRMDYLARDTRMSGFVNAPVDLDCLARSVTAVKDSTGWLVPAFRDQALTVIDTMFHAKITHDIGVLSRPAGVYDAALREMCIRAINENEEDTDGRKRTYISTVFSLDALANGNVTWKGKRYRLLCDADILSDLDARNGQPFDELLTRLPGQRRTAAWRSYYEYHHIFNDPNRNVTPEDVYKFFQPLLAYMKETHQFVFDASFYLNLPKSAGTLVRDTAKFLHDYLVSLTTDPKEKERYNVVLLERDNNFTMKIDPAQVRIVFPKKSLPLREKKFNYSTYDELAGVTIDDRRLRSFFYLYRYNGLDQDELAELRKRLGQHIKKRRSKGLL